MEGGDFQSCLQAAMVIILGLMPVATFLNAFDRLENRIEAGARTLDFLNHVPSIHPVERTKGPLFPMQQKPPAVTPYEVFGKKLVVDNVKFFYAQRPEISVLKSVSLEVQLGAGQVIGLCGPSGGGKSSLLALLMRFYDPTSGVIRIEGLGNLRDLDIQRWRRSIGYVAQEPTLFQDTLINNVRCGCPEAGPEAVAQAAAMAHMDFVCDAPDFDPAERLDRPQILMKGELNALGLTEESFDLISAAVSSGSSSRKIADGLSKADAKKAQSADVETPAPSGTSEALRWRDMVRTTTLSGGQKQRVAIARALLRQPSILIFEEATSALDSYSEQTVQESLKSVRKQQTQFLIAHRLSTIAEADLILVVAMGVIAEMGTSEELLAKRGVYYNLVRGSQ